MSTFTLKIIALIAMFIDHSSVLLYDKELISPDFYTLMRAVGRMAFPLYCFLLVKGFSYTRDRNAYIQRLMSFALISQIPFTLYFSHSSRCVWGGADFIYGPYILIVLALLWLCLYLTGCSNRNPGEMLITAAFILLPGITLRFGTVYILDGKMSIFYSLCFGLILLDFIDKLKAKQLSPGSIILFILCMSGALYFIQPHADYGLSAIILILGLYFFDTRKLFQTVFICIWAFCEYGFYGSMLIYSLFVCMAALAVYFYNGRKGPSAKYVFYLFYPVHLLLLSLFLYL